MAATESPMATIKFKNYGKTPALIAKWNSVSFILKACQTA